MQPQISQPKNLVVAHFVAPDCCRGIIDILSAGMSILIPVGVNLGAVGVHIAKVDIEGVPPLEGEVIFDCDERVNLFIGPNSSGKSTVLRAINGLNLSVFDWTGDNYAISLPNVTNDRKMGYCFLWPSDDWPRDDRGDIIDNAMPVVYIPATRVNLPGRDFFSKNQILDSEDDDGSSSPLDALFATDSGIFYGRFVELAINQLRDEMSPYPPSPENRTIGWTLSGMNINRDRQSQLRKALEVGHSCAKSVCLEVIYDNSPHSYVESNDGDEKLVRYAMGIGTTDHILGEPLYAGALSSGTQGTLLWIWALALKMVHHYDWQEGWEKQPAILLIDEIENHLHPTWQRRVIPALLDHFPGLQIFATTHSPFVVAGCEAGQVHLLKRDEKGHVTASTNTEDIIGWTADEISRTWMDVDEPTDLTTIERSDRLRQLRQKETLTAEEESELNNLRRQVNESLLSRGSPMEAQRERYADLMQRFLQTRQSDLNQDGG